MNCYSVVKLRRTSFPPSTQHKILALLKRIYVARLILAHRIKITWSSVVEVEFGPRTRKMRYQAPSISCFARGSIDSSSNETSRDLEMDHLFFFLFDISSNSRMIGWSQGRKGEKNSRGKGRRGRNFDLFAVASTDRTGLSVILA